MTDYEDLLRQSAAAPGWTIEARQNRISARGVPYRKKGGEAGRCQIAVETQEDGLTMQAPEHGGARHAARLIGVSDGCAYQASGEPVGNVLWTDGANECVISIKRDEGEYVNAWHALFVYTARVAGEVGREEREQAERIFEFEVAGEDSRDMRAWRGRARGQRIGIVGLGGVGLWILDLMSKTDVSEIRDTLNKAIMARIVLVGAVMADENCLLRVVGDSSILSVSPHRDRLWTGSGSIGPFEPSTAHATLPDDAPPSAGCQTPAAPLDAPCSCPIHGSAPWHNQSGASHTGMDAPP